MMVHSSAAVRSALLGLMTNSVPPAGRLIAALAFKISDRDIVMS